MSYIEELCCVNWRFRSFVQYTCIFHQGFMLIFVYVLFFTYYFLIKAHLSSIPVNLFMAEKRIVFFSILHILDLNHLCPVSDFSIIFF